MAFDLLVDDCGAVWLMEVNSKPALHAQSPSLKVPWIDLVKCLATKVPFKCFTKTFQCFWKLFSCWKVIEFALWEDMMNRGVLAGRQYWD